MSFLGGVAGRVTVSGGRRIDKAGKATAPTRVPTIAAMRCMVPLVLMIMLLSACGRPPATTVQQVLVELDKPRDDAQRAVLVDTGQRLFAIQNCHLCHAVEGSEKSAPTLAYLVGQDVELADGSVVVADRAYLARSIVEPQAQRVAGYALLMSNYRFLATDQVAALVAYLESLSPRYE